MIYDYEIKKRNQEEILYLYFDFNSEFAKANVKEKKKKLKGEIEAFIKKHKIHFKGSKVAIVVSGFIVGTVLLGSPNMALEQNISQPENNMVNTTIVELPFYETQDNIATENTETKEENNEEIIRNSGTNETSKMESSQNEKTTSNNTQVTTAEETQVAQIEENKVQSEALTEAETTEEVENKTYVTVYRSNGTVLTIEFEEYIIGVVGAEMPASFHSEALKAQAILARTYATKTLERNGVLTDNSSTQNYKTNDELKSMWGSSYNTYYNKIKSAVESTSGMYLTYQGEIIDAVYHSTSNGITEDAINVWGNSVPYLVSVDSPYDSTNSSFQVSISFSYEELSSKFGFTINPDTNFNILSYTSGNRVENIMINETTYTGVQVRNLLGLRSADFSISKTDASVTFTTKGYGHGVGMSQYGANGMAKNGSSYQQILQHYYKGVTITQK